MMDINDANCLLERSDVALLEVNETTLNGAPTLHVTGSCRLSDFEVRAVRLFRTGNVCRIEVEIGYPDRRYDRTSNFTADVPLTPDVTEVHLGDKGDIIWTKAGGPNLSHD
jgi:hypothetical protein